MRRAARRIAAAAFTLLALIALTLGLFLLPPVVHLLLDLALHFVRIECLLRPKEILQHLLMSMCLARRHRHN